MTTELKVKLANLTIVIITLTVVVVFFWFVVQTVSSAFHLNVFAEKTSEFFILLLGAALAIVFSAALLNICLNLSILADARIRELPTQQNATFGKSFFLILAGLLLAIIASLFGGDYLSRRQEKDRLISECNDLVSRYQVSVVKIATALKDTSIIDDIPTILEFLSSQKSDYNDIALIVATEFDGQTTFLHMNDNMLSSSLKIPYWGSAFYRCKERDSKYLMRVFKEQLRDPFVWSEANDHYLYLPVEANGTVFVLHFSKFSRYGKIGS